MPISGLCAYDRETTTANTTYSIKLTSVAGGATATLQGAVIAAYEL